MTESTSTKTKQRKLAWQFEDLAWKIQFPERQMAAKILLCFLAKQANNSGSSYAGYKYNMLHTNIRSETTFSNALKYLEGLGLLSWKSGGGGTKGDTNHYTLNIIAMRKLVKEQGLFDLATGKMIRPTPVTGVASDLKPTKPTMLIVVASVASKPETDSSEDVTDSSDCKSDSNEGSNRLQSQESKPLYFNPLESNPLENQPSENPLTTDDGGAESFSDVSQTVGSGEVQAQDEKCPCGQPIDPTFLTADGVGPYWCGGDCIWSNDVRNGGRR